MWILNQHLLQPLTGAAKHHDIWYHRSSMRCAVIQQHSLIHHCCTTATETSTSRPSSVCAGLWLGQRIQWTCGYTYRYIYRLCTEYVTIQYGMERQLLFNGYMTLRTRDEQVKGMNQPWPLKMTCLFQWGHTCYNDEIWDPRKNANKQHLVIMISGHL